MATVPKQERTREIEYPSGDGKPVAETELHVRELSGAFPSRWLTVIRNVELAEEKRCPNRFACWPCMHIPTTWNSSVPEH